MNIVIDLFELKKLFADMAELGASASEKRREPIADRLKQREVYRWFKSINKDPALLKKMVSDGLIKKQRIGKAKNSPVYYSRFEIQAALKAVEQNRIINNF